MTKKLPQTLSETEFLDRLKKVNKPTHKMAFMLGFYNCMRVSEVVKLTPQNVDRDRGFFHIKNAKGGKDRDVPIMKPVYRGLKHIPVGCGVRALQIASRKYLDIKFHTLRHSGATYYLHKKRVDIRYLQQLLGHSRLDTTQIYTHVNPEGLKKRFDEVW